ncbi:hypothetical protein ColLi_10272 [Colletotrichum liriopes]|uniref:Uncharacterized protein n=1 Tax=Colletotrichum liriopes TaxID=708192 RepID=A0AA37GUC3_9PEZI|nr:hypothetical protein ColLi_10272 [Colletotrichum liriopes]
MAFRLVTLCLATAVAAAPAFVPRTINGTEFNPERGLVAGEVLLYDMDHMEVVHEEYYATMLATEGILANAPEVDHSLLDFEAPTEEEIKKLDARQTSCGTTTSVVITRTDRFFDWDLQMSPVVVAGANPMDISYASTFTVTDTITVNGAFSPPL